MTFSIPLTLGSRYVRELPIQHLPTALGLKSYRVVPRSKGRVRIWSPPVTKFSGSVIRTPHDFPNEDEARRYLVNRAREQRNSAPSQ